jgi:hypothetical protein
MMTLEFATLSDFDRYACPLCDNHTPRYFCQECEEAHCLYCFDAYGCEGCE